MSACRRGSVEEEDPERRQVLCHLMEEQEETGRLLKINKNKQK